MRLRANETEQLPAECYGECIASRALTSLVKCRWLARTALMQHRVLSADA